MTIWKFPLELADVQTVAVPGCCRWLAAQVQGGRICAWAMCDPDGPKQDRRIRIVGTGHPAPVNGEHIGTVQMPDGFVWHVFEVP